MPPILDGRYGYVVQSHNARQLGDISRECPEIVIAPVDLDGNRQLGIEVLDLLLSRLEQFKLQTTTQAGLVDLDQQRLDFRLVRQLLEQRAE